MAWDRPTDIFVNLLKNISPFVRELNHQDESLRFGLSKRLYLASREACMSTKTTNPIANNYKELQLYRFPSSQSTFERESWRVLWLESSLSHGTTFGGKSISYQVYFRDSGSKAIRSATQLLRRGTYSTSFLRSRLFSLTNLVRIYF